MRTIPEIYDMLKKSFDKDSNDEDEFETFNNSLKEKEAEIKKKLEDFSQKLKEGEEKYKEAFSRDKYSSLENNFKQFEDDIKKEEEKYGEKLTKLLNDLQTEKEEYEKTLKNSLKQFEDDIKEKGSEYNEKLANLLNDLQTGKEAYKNEIGKCSEVLLEEVKNFEKTQKKHAKEIEDSVDGISKECSEFVFGLDEDLSQGFDDVNCTLKNKIKNIEKALSLVAQIAGESRPLFAVSAYEKCQRFKDNINLLEASAINKISSSADVSFIKSFHGFRASEKLNILLVGEFSSGKTTFTRRLIKDISGAISPSPETASIIVHRDGAEHSISMEFQDRVVFSDDDEASRNPRSAETKSTDFVKFLREFDLEKNFRGEGNTIWIPADKTYIEDRWSKDKVLDFVKKINAFPEVFKHLTWTHVKSRADRSLSTILDFADICDMPGIAGDKSHDAVIDSIFDTFYPDIILYLVDTAKGVPSDDEVIVIRELVRKIVDHGNESAPDFYWVFQKPSESTLTLENLNLEQEIGDVNCPKNEWLENKTKEEIGNFIRTLETGNNKIDAFAKEEIAFLKNTYVIDARGGVKDSEQAQNAIASTLLYYYMLRGEGYIKKAKGLFSKSPELPSVLSYPMKMSDEEQDNPIIKSVLQLTRDSSDTSLDNFKKVLLDALCVERTIPEAERSIMPNDMYNILKQWHGKIIKTVENMANKSSRPRSILTKMNPWGKDPEVSWDYLRTEFCRAYETTTEWQEALYLAQAYNWISVAHSGNIAFHFINEIGNDILRNISKELGEIKTLAESNHYIEKVAGKNNDENTEFPGFVKEVGL